MLQNFWNKQPTKKQEKYIQLLSTLGKLSGLFSESASPYLYYRVHEKLFCKVFEAYDLSRGDISFDVKKDNLGIGLKTFLHQNGKTFQKISEFNADGNILREFITDEDLILKISQLRNTRLKNTLNQTDTSNMIYSLVTRDEGVFNILEYPMDNINIDKIKNINSNKNTKHFVDDLHEYSYSKSKSTLMKRFVISESDIITKIPIEILKNPFDILEQLNFELTLNLDKDCVGEEIYLPLYSPRTKNVEEKSGLNQWNAGGRKRDPYEVYIPIPSFIHKDYPTFFNYTGKDTPNFTIMLPNGKELSARVCQSGGKALMSNPNSDLGKWILHDILQLAPKTLVTKNMLIEIGIDSIKLTKLKENLYALDFSKNGSFERFIKEEVNDNGKY